MTQTCRLEILSVQTQIQPELPPQGQRSLLNRHSLHDVQSVFV